MTEPAAREGDGQLQKVRTYLRRLATSVTKAHEFQVVRREREDGEIEYQIFADTTRPKNGMQVAYVQSTRHDAEFVAACLAQAPLFDKLLAEGEAAQTALRQLREDAEWRSRWHVRLGRGLAQPEGRFYEQIAAMQQQVEQLRAENARLKGGDASARTVHAERETENPRSAVTGGTHPVEQHAAEARETALRQQVERLQKDLAITTLAVPLEEELAGRIDEMCKYLSMEDGFTLNGIARLLVQCQTRMAADWVEVGRVRRELKAAEAVQTALRQQVEQLRTRAVVAEQHKTLSLLGKSSWQEVVEDKLRTELAETQIKLEATEAERVALRRENERLKAQLVIVEPESH